ncbi:MAG: hypothetical protein J6R75_01515 [Candidatus Methanomethylophilaceae archaeon]|nr:hypothetical protein [Candidatus Methanomethylophilaceae archaeon]
MKKTGLVLALATLFIVATVCATGSVDAASGSESSFPSASEILSTVEWPDYSFQTFLDDAKIMFSAEMMGQVFTYIGDLFSFLGEETFLAEPTTVQPDSFTGDAGYINIFVAICLGIAFICIFGAIIAYLANRGTFKKARKSE